MRAFGTVEGFHRSCYAGIVEIRCWKFWTSVTKKTKACVGGLEMLIWCRKAGIICRIIICGLSGDDMKQGK